MNERVMAISRKPEGMKENHSSLIGNNSEPLNKNFQFERILYLQRTAGNQAVEKLMRSGALQAKLKIGQPGDAYEREADSVAEQIMQMPKARKTNILSRRGNGKCIRRSCPKCKKEKLNRKPSRETIRAKENPGHVSEVDIESSIRRVRNEGQQLPASVRGFFEQGFGHDLGRVRVHAGMNAAESARMLNAQAYTIGNDIVFGAGQYTPETHDGKKLIAHELTHVIQQNPAGAFIQRRLTVNPGDSVPLPPGIIGPPTPLTHAVQGLLADTCPEGNFRVDPVSGVVTPSDRTFCEWPGIPYRGELLRADLSRTPVGCRCICDVINHGQTTNIEFRPGGPGTTPVGPRGTGPGSPSIGADPRFRGQYRIGGRWVDIPFHLILSHELCGHALPLMRGTHAARAPIPPGGTPAHEREAVDVERGIAAEHQPPLPRRPEDYAGGARERP